MTSERLQQVRELFLEVLLLSPADRDRLLTERCAGDPELRERVERLVASDLRAEEEEFLPVQETTNGDRSSRRLLVNNAHVRCPHCNHPIEIVGLDAVDTVYCPSCHSSFRVERHASNPWGPWVGEKLIDRFELIEAIGYGAFGAVYKARDPQLDRIVALKVLRAGNLASEAEKARFLREMRSNAQLRHQAIVTVHEVGEYQGSPFIISDFVRGVTLADWLSARRPTFEVAAGVIAELADALEHSHTNSVVHRDVKPSNIMIDEDGRPHLMDFGLAKRDAGEIAITLDGQILGTPAYMSPEQARGEGSTVDGRTDVYSLGVILYEMLTGELPFRGNTRMLLYQVLNDEPRPPTSLNDRIPIDLETICLQSMSKEPARRYLTAGDLALDLRCYMSGLPIKGRPVDSFERTWRWCRRNRVLASAACLTAASLMAVAILSVVIAVNSNHRLLESYRHLAVVDFNVGQSACERGEVEAGVLWLERCLSSASKARDPDWMRAAEASLAAWSRELPPLTGVFSHDGNVLLAAFSPDGKTVVTASADGTARLWDVATGSPRSGPLKHDGTVRFAAFSSDGTMVVTASDDRTARLWNVASGQQRSAPFRHEHPVMLARFSSDGASVWTVDTKTARQWDVASGEAKGTVIQHGARLGEARISPDGRTLLVGGYDKEAHLWDLESGRRSGEPLLHPDKLWGAAFSPDSKTVATGCGDKKVRLWDVATGQLLRPPLDHDHPVCSIAFSPDGRTLVAGTDGKVAKLWDVSTGISKGEPLRHDGVVRSTAFSPDGKTVLTGGWDNSARLWDASTGRPIGRLFRHQGAVNRAIFSPDGSAVLTAGTDRTARLWSIAGPAHAARPLLVRDKALAAAMSADGRTVVVGTESGDAIECDATSGTPIGAPWQHGSAVCAVGLGPDGATALTGSLDGRVKFWNRKTGLPIGQPIELPERVYAYAFSPNNKTVAVTGGNQAKLCDLATGRVRGQTLQHGDMISSVIFSPDGKFLVTGSDDKTARIWDAVSGEPIGQPIDHPNRVMSVALGRDAKTLITGCMDGSARLWDVFTRQERARPLTHQGGVEAVALSADGRTVVTASFDKTASLWDLATGMPRGQKLVGHDGPVIFLATSKVGRLAATASFDRTARLWDSTLGLPIGPPLLHPERITGVEISSDETKVLTTSQDGIARVWDIARVDRESELNPHSISGLSGLRLTDQGEIAVLDNGEWQKHRVKLPPDR